MFVVVAVLMAAKCVSLDGGRAAGSGETTQMCRSNTPQQRNYMGVTEGKKKLSVQIEIKSQMEARVCMPHSVHFHAAMHRPLFSHHLRAGLKTHSKEAEFTWLL